MDDWLQNVNDNDPEAISNLDEMTNLVDSLITLNQNVNYGISIEGWVEHNYQFTNCCDSSLGGGHVKTMKITTILLLIVPTSR